MKRLPLVIALASALLPLPSATAQTPLTSSTPVIGFYKFDVPVGTSAWVVGFVTRKEFQGAATSVAPGANQPDGTPTSIISQSGVTWANNQFPLHYIEVLSAGNSQGAVLDIVGTTATSLTVRGTLTGTPNYCVRKHVTLLSALPEAVSPPGQPINSGLVPFSDSVTLYNSNNTVSSYFPSANGSWLADDFATSANNAIIYPGQGLIISSSRMTTLTVGGGEVAYVKSGPTQVPVYRGQTNFVGPINPMVVTNAADPLYNAISSPTAGGGVTPLGSVGFTTSSFASFQDSITLFTQGGELNPAGSYFTSGSNIIADDFFTVANNVPLRNGYAVAVTVEEANRILTINQQHPSN